MANVRILPQVLAHQIAAGEVIERPASVVKELIENALDADSTQIHVQVEEGGRTRITVTDDGIGMAPEDAELAFRHHATSKIESFEDLMDIRTLGFRGEALPSIASVSRTTLRSVAKETPETEAPQIGTEISYVGGELRLRREVSWPRGTEVIVEDLFFNVPARRKFLKTVATELSHISRLVMSYALAYPDVEFRLTHDKKVLIDAPVVEDPLDRIFQLLGETVTANLVPLEYQKEGISVLGFASLPHEQRNSASSLYLFVNRRMVRDRVITHAIRSAYRDLIPAAAFPVVVLFLEIDPALIDVNVHPTKVEIRFKDSQSVHTAITHAIERSLILNRARLSDLARDIPFNREPSGQRQSGVQSSVERFLRRRMHESFSFGGLGSRSSSVDWIPDGAGMGKSISSTRPAAGSPSSVHGDSIPETAHLSESPVILGQFVESFLIAVDREGVMLIDQHVAHERILYDRSVRDLASGKPVMSQKLLIPVTLELDPRQKSIAEAILDQLNRNGFEVEWFGTANIIIRAVPALAKELDPASVIDDLFRELESLDEFRDDSAGEGGPLARLQEKIAISLSCRAAVKINTPLTSTKMQWLIDELFACENPYTCPHGRPIVLRLSLEEVLRSFKRI